MFRRQHYVCYKVTIKVPRLYYPYRKQDAQNVDSGPVLVHRPCFLRQESMQTNTSAGLQFSGHDDSRRIDDDRLTRALTQGMEVAIRDDPLAYEVEHDGSTYDVDVDTGVCGCGDYTHRGDAVVCKHVLRAAITHAFRGVRNPSLVARVLGRLDDVGCAHGVSWCNGPAALPDDGPVPCEDCIATTPGHWATWCRLHHRPLDVDAELAHAGPIALADGGSDEGHDDTDDRFRLPEDPKHVSEQTAREPNTIVDANGDEVPARSETADFGGGSSSGVDEL